MSGMKSSTCLLLSVDDISNVHSEVVVVVDNKDHLPPCDCGDCDNCDKYGPGPFDLNGMLELYPNVQSLWIQWHGNRMSGPPLTPHHRHQGSFDRLIELKVLVDDEAENRAQNSLKDAAEIVHHFRLPVLERLVLDVRRIGTSEMFIEGCKMMDKAARKFKSTTLKSFELNIDQLYVDQLPQPPIWVSQVPHE
jgi:hypothetical protein